MSEWIDVKDRLPEDSRRVIICLLGSVVFVGHYNHGKAKWRMGLETRDRTDGSIVAVTHWMPLPDPPANLQDTAEPVRHDGHDG